MEEQFRGVEDLVDSALIFAYTDLIRDLWQLQGYKTGKKEFDAFLKHVLVKTHEEINVSTKYVKELIGMMDIDNIHLMKKNILGMIALQYPKFINTIIDVDAMDDALPKLSPKREAQLHRQAERMTRELMRKTRPTDKEDDGR